MQALENEKVTACFLISFLSFRSSLSDNRMDKMESLRDGRLRRDSQIKGLYEFEKTLGKGHFAIVKLAKHLYTGKF